VAQNSNEISPVFFSAFPDQHLDSLENPAYAADFKSAEGRLFLLPSASEPYWDFSKLKNNPKFDISISPQLTFFTPIPGSRLVVGGGVSAFGVRSEDLSDYRSPNNTNHYRQVLRLNAYNASLVAAYSFGDHGKTSVGIGVDKLSGFGNFLSEINNYRKDSYQVEFYDNLRARFARTRLTFGLTSRFSNSKKLGLYYRHSVNSSDQENTHVHKREYMDRSYPSSSYFIHGKTNISNLSSEIGARFRASLTRRLFYGVEGSYLYERINNQREMPNHRNYNHYLARRARLGVGLGYALTSKILLNFDVTGGIFNNDRPAQEPVNSSGNFFSSSLAPGSLRSVQGTSVSTHEAVQTNLWRGLFLSASNLTTVRRDVVLYSYSGGTYAINGVVYSYDGGTAMNKELYDAKLSNAGIGWKFKPNLTAEYLYSVDHRYRESSHSIKIRYTFNLGITGEK
jgi:hypothetical protein